MIKRNLSNKGQTLLVVIFSLTLALLVVVSVASRAVNSITRTTQTNYYQKATAAADAGAEIYATLNSTSLHQASLLTGCPASKLKGEDIPPSGFPSSCIVDVGEEARAFIGVEDYPSPGESLELRGGPGETVHVDLEGMSGANAIEVCWYGANGAYADSYYFIYHDSLDVIKNARRCVSTTGDWCDNSSLPADYTGVPVEDVSEKGIYSCYQVEVLSQPTALRLFSFPGGAVYKITALFIDASNNISVQSLPSQGHRIISIGEVKSGGNTSLDKKRQVLKKTIVEKSLPYPQDPWYDFAIFSLNGIITGVE